MYNCKPGQVMLYLSLTLIPSFSKVVFTVYIIEEDGGEGTRLLLYNRVQLYRVGWTGDSYDNMVDLSCTE